MGLRKETWPYFSEIGKKKVKGMQSAKFVGVEAGNWGSSHLIFSVSYEVGSKSIAKIGGSDGSGSGSGRNQK